MSKGAFAVITALLNILTVAVAAQPRGLVFSSYEVAQERRTSLDLSANGPLCLSDDFELAFDLSFLPDRNIYFGYIFRLVNRHQQNIDLVYSQQSRVFEIITGDGLSGIRYSMQQKALFERWSRIGIRVKGNTLSCYVNGQLMGKAKLGLQDVCFRMLFGACRYGDFKSTDLPPMRLRNVALSVNGRLRYYWPLQTPVTGYIPDSLQAQPAVVAYPTWVADLHAHWQPLQAVNVNGNASITFDKARELLYITARDTLYTYAVKTRTITATALTSTAHVLLLGNQSFFHPDTRALYNLSIDQHKAAVFDTIRRQWQPAFDTAAVTAYWHANKFYSPADNALYMLGGYGQLQYKRQLWRYRFADSVWEQLSPKGDFYTPRYLAALGATPTGDTAYILGGYGSTTGEQIVNPRYLYDLLLLDVQRQSFKKIYTLPAPAVPFVLASSMILQGQDYYALIFPNDRYNSRLQLIKGSLLLPEYSSVADTIPFDFQDNRSAADLFFCPDSKQLLTATSLRLPNSTTAIKLYSIAFPPGDIATPAYTAGRHFHWGALLLGVLLLALIPYLFYQRPAQRQEAAVALPRGEELVVSNSMTEDPQTTIETNTLPLLPENKPPDVEDMATGADRRDNQSAGTDGGTMLPVADSKRPQSAGTDGGTMLPVADSTRLQSAGTDNKAQPPVGADGKPLQPAGADNGYTPDGKVTQPDGTATGKPAILLFGSFAVTDGKGNDISRLFTPLLKELFLLIVIHTIKQGPGITPEHLNEILWNDKSSEAAKNNRAVNMRKLKTILEQLDNITLKKEAGRWMLQYEPVTAYIDLEIFQQLVQQRAQLDRAHILQLLQVVKRGAFLQQTEYRWLDDIKSDISNQALDVLIQASTMFSSPEDAPLQIEIANCIFSFDAVNEQALRLKCRSLVLLGRHAIAKNTYEQFVKEYRHMYAEDFPETYPVIIG